MNIDVFDAIAHPTRREILEILSHQSLALHTLSEKFPMTRVAVAKHLKILEAVGLVTETPIGSEHFYNIQPNALQTIRSWLDHIEQLNGGYHDQSSDSDPPKP
jgi:DNA-binding transcriptional ArsR family regulator